MSASMTQDQLQSTFDAFDNLTALIIGDVMVDAYFWGNINRISPEAPVPVVEVARKENRLGGAANVALNIQALGATPLLCSVIGQDEHGTGFRQLLEKRGMPNEGIVQVESRPTTVKTRIIGGNQQVLRVDEEVTHDLSDAHAQSMLDRIRSLVESRKVDVIIFEDYDKGVITPWLIAEVVHLANQHNIPTTVDPKKRNFGAYAGTTLFKPNLKELREGLNVDISTDEDSIAEAVAVLREDFELGQVLVTLSEKGAYVSSDEFSGIIPAHVRTVSDVSGAGDTVISMASLCLALGLASKHVAMLSNLAGGQVVERVGVVPVNKEQLLKEAIQLTLA